MNSTYKIGDIVVILFPGKFQHKSATVIGFSSTGKVLRLQVAKGFIRLFPEYLVVLESVFNSELYQLMNNPKPLK